MQKGDPESNSPTGDKQNLSREANIRAYKLYCSDCMRAYHFPTPFAREGAHVFTCKRGHKIVVPSVERMLAVYVSEYDLAQE